MNSDPILFFHCVDAENLNAQSNNTKALLSRWDSAGLPAAVFHFRTPDPIVAANPNVRLIKLPPNRLWKSRALAAGLGQVSAVFFPGFAPSLDDRVRGLRRALGREVAVISTLEGLPVSHKKQTEKEEFLSSLAGHPVFCQSVVHKNMAALNRTKANSDLIIGISPFLRRMAAEIWPQPLKADIPLGVELRIFHSDGRLPHGHRRRVRVVCAGNFHARKRPEMFLKLANYHTDADFVWYGDGPLRQPLLEQVKAQNLTNLSFPGPAAPIALAEAFRSADIFALPSISEGVPKVTQEAAACGLPIVCMNYYEPISVVNGINGFQAQDDHEFCSYLRALIEDAGMRVRLGGEGTSMARKWDWDHLAKIWQEKISLAALMIK